MLPLPRDPVRSAEANINHLQTIFCLRSRTACLGDIPIAAELYSGTFVIYSTKKYVLPMAQLGLLVFTLLGLCACCMGVIIDLILLTMLLPDSHSRST
jgi:hypothetical protein